MNLIKSLSPILLIICFQFVSYANSRIASDSPLPCKERKLFYTVQIGVYSKIVPSSSFPKEAQPISYIKRVDGLYNYFSGKYDSRFDATVRRFELASIGLHDSYLAVYYLQKRISIKQADDLISENGSTILFKFNTDEIAENRID